MIAVFIAVLHKQMQRRGTVNYMHHFIILLTTLHDNVDCVHHPMSTNRTEEKGCIESDTCIDNVS